MIKIVLTNTQRVVWAARPLVAIAAAWFLAGGVAFAQPAQDMPRAPDPSAAPQSSVKISKVFMALPAGTPWLSLRVGSLLCISNPIVQSWPGGRQAQEISPYYVPFKRELEGAGYKVVTPGEDNLFDQNAGSADYEVAAVITYAHFDGCVMNGAYFTDRGSVRGNGSMTVDWQIYSPLKKQVVAHFGTSGTAMLANGATGGVPRLITEAFASNARELASNASFRAAMSAPRAFTEGFQVPGQQSKIALDGSLKASTRPIADAVGSVVTIMTGTGSGSGILVSDDGYILTNAHVVGDDKEVRVRWSDGIEALAQVERVAKVRDVAIIKTNARDRRPLAIKRGAVSPG